MKKLFALMTVMILPISGFGSAETSLAESEDTMANIPQVNVGGTVYNLKDTEARNEITDLKSALSNRLNGYFYPSIIEGEYVDANTGEIKKFAGWARTDYVPVGKIRTLTLRSNVTSGYNFFYDANKSPIKNFNIVSTDTTYSVPNNAEYMIISNTLAGLQGTVGHFEMTTEHDARAILEKMPLHYLPIAFVEGKYIDYNTGEEQNAIGYYYSNLINCEHLPRIRFDNVGGEATSYNAFYDADGNYISSFSIGAVKSSIVIPSNAVYFRLSGTRNFADNVKISDPFWNSYEYSLSNLNWILDNIAKGYLSYPIVYNTYINNGIETPDASSRSSGFIACDIGDIFEITTTHANNYNAYYDENKAFVRMLRLENGKNTITIPVGVKYFRISEAGSVMDNTTIKKINTSGGQADPTSILNLNPETTVKGVLENLNWDRDAAEQTYDYTPFVLLHFTDIHASSVQLSRIMQFYDHYNEYFDDILHTGDAVLTAFEDDFNFWTTCGAGKVLNICGNHDVWTSRPAESGCAQWTVGYSAKQGYARYIAPFVNDWNVDGYVQDKMYWYKDYIDSNIRLIGIDIYHWREIVHLSNGETSTTYPNQDHDAVDNGEQASWLNNVLTDAKTNGRHVIIASHAPYPHTRVESNFMTLDELTDAGNYGLPASAVQIVQSFIDAGGNFVCWITGHAHQDMTCRLNNFQDQFLICLDTAMGERDDDHTFWSNNKKVPGTKSMDAFNIFSVDVNKKYLRLYRIGLDYDRHGRHIGSLIYDYDNHNLIYTD